MYTCMGIVLDMTIFHISEQAVHVQKYGLLDCCMIKSHCDTYCAPHHSSVRQYGCLAQLSHLQHRLV